MPSSGTYSSKLLIPIVASARLSASYIVTAQRREEAASLHWEELDRREREWRLPSHRTKNGEPNSVPLNDLAIAALDLAAKGDTWPKYGRFSPTSTGAGFTGYAKGKDSSTDSLLKIAGTGCHLSDYMICGLLWQPVSNASGSNLK